MRFVYLFLLSSFAISAMAVNYHPPGYFDSSDVTKVTWAHGVNSKKDLEDNLKDNSIQMLEADIVLGTLQGSNDTNITVIMAHPPANTSDLTFEMFVNEVITHNKDLEVSKRKGMKLDFKQLEAAEHEKGLALLKSRNQTELEFPIWINADILKGPVDAGESRIDGKRFIEQQVLNVPNGTLSLGWTTRFGKQSNDEIIKNGSYSREQVDQMAQLIKEYYTPQQTDSARAEITFPLRAGLALNSVENIKHLLDGSGINFTSPSVTLWEGSDDPPIEQNQLNNFTAAINKSRVFVDLPHSFPRNGGSQSMWGKEMSNSAITLSAIFTFMLYYLL